MKCRANVKATKRDVDSGHIRCRCGAWVPLGPPLSVINYTGNASGLNPDDVAWVDLPEHEPGTGQLSEFDRLLLERKRV